MTSTLLSWETGWMITSSLTKAILEEEQRGRWGECVYFEMYWVLIGSKQSKHEEGLIGVRIYSSEV